MKQDTRKTRAARTHLRGFARDMRSRATDTERTFWTNVRAHRFNGLKFKRQVPIGPYIADFVCGDACLIVEIDGQPHESSRRHDRQRDAFLSPQGFLVLRFWNHEVSADIDGVLQIVGREIAARLSRS
ncbi:MAG: endonuclease domain-containing protein [Rhizomicrobium sp.]